MKARITFDTLEYANLLKSVGVETTIAETQAKANANMFASLIDNTLVTKQDLSQSEARLERGIRETQNHLETQLLKMDLQLAQTKSELKQDILLLKQDIHALETRLIIRLGAIVLGTVTLFSGLPTLLHSLL